MTNLYPPASSNVRTEGVADDVSLQGPVVEKSCKDTAGTLHGQCDQSMTLPMREASR